MIYIFLCFQSAVETESHDYFSDKILPILITFVLSSLLMFLLGRWSTQDIEKRKERKRLKEMREFFYFNLLLFKTGLEDQLSEFHKLTAILNKEKVEGTLSHISFELVVAAQPGPVLEIDKKDVLKFFILQPSSIKGKTMSPEEKERRIALYQVLYNNLESHSMTIKKAFREITEMDNEDGANLKLIDTEYNKLLDYLSSEFNPPKPYSNPILSSSGESQISPLKAFHIIFSPKSLILCPHFSYLQIFTSK